MFEKRLTSARGTIYSVAASTTIAAAPETIWSLLSDPNRYPELVDPTARMIAVPDEPMRVGYLYRDYGGVPPFRGESTWLVTLFEPMRRQIHVGDDGSVTKDLIIQIDPDGDGSRLTQSLELTPRWYLAPLNAFLWPILTRRRARRAMRRTVLNVKRAAEAMELAMRAG